MSSRKGCGQINSARFRIAGPQRFKSLRRRGIPPDQTRSTVYTCCQEVNLSQFHFLGGVSTTTPLHPCILHRPERKISERKHAPTSAVLSLPTRMGSRPGGNAGAYLPL